MPKPRYKVSNFEKDLLLHNIYMKTGFIIQTKNDCSKIARIVSEKNDFISESTIYRLFLLKNKSYTPYMHTLNVLSKFCEYENWSDLIKKNQATQNTLYPYHEGEIANGFNGVVSCSIKLNDFSVLRDYLLQLPYDTPDQKCHAIGNESFRNLLEYPKSCPTFYKSFCDVPVMRKSFFELLADPDFDLPQYALALEQYLKSTVNDSSIKFVQDTIFALSLLTRHHYLHANKSDFEKYSKLLFKYENVTSPDFESISAFPKARSYMYKVFYLKAFKSENDQRNYEKWLIDYLSEEKYKFSFQDANIWIHTILDMKPYLIESTKFEKTVHSIFSLFMNMYPNDIINQVRYLDTSKLLDYTNQNSSAHWKKVWKS